MGNALDFILRLTDLLTPGMRAAASVADSVATRIQNNFNRAAGGSRTMSASVDELRTRLEAVNRVRFGTRIESEFRSATRSARELEEQIHRLENSGRRTGGAFSSIGRNLMAAASFAAVAGFAGSSVSAAMDFQTTNKTYEVLTGSQQKGAALSNQLLVLKQNTILGTSVYGNAQTLMGFGISEKEVIKDLKMLGDVSMGNKDRFSSLTLAFSQTRAAGRLMGQDLLQYINAGFNPLGVMSERWKEFGFKSKVSVGDLKKMMEEGKISAAVVTKSFELATGEGGRYNNMMNKIAETSGGKLLLLQGKFAAFKISLGNALMPLADFLISIGNHALNFIHELASGNPAAIAFAVAIAGITAAIMWNTIATNVAAFATTAWGVAQAAVNAIMNLNPIVLIVALIIALGLWIYSLTQKYDGWGKSMSGLWEVVKGFVKQNIIAWKDFGQSIWYWVQFVWLKVQGFVEWVGGAFHNVMKALQLASQFKFSEAKAALNAEIKTTASKQIEDLEKRRNEQKRTNQQEALEASLQMAKGWNSVGLTRKKEVAKAVDPTTANNSGGTAGGNDESLITEGKGKSGNINSGGQRSIVVNIGKQIEKMEVHVMNASEGVAEIEGMVREALRRTLYSLNNVTT